MVAEWRVVSETSRPSWPSCMAGTANRARDCDANRHRRVVVLGSIPPPGVEPYRVMRRRPAGRKQDLPRELSWASTASPTVTTPRDRRNDGQHDDNLGTPREAVLLPGAPRQPLSVRVNKRPTPYNEGAERGRRLRRHSHVRMLSRENAW